MAGSVCAPLLPTAPSHHASNTSHLVVTNGPRTSSGGGLSAVLCSHRHADGDAALRRCRFVARLVGLGWTQAQARRLLRARAASKVRGRRGVVAVSPRQVCIRGVWSLRRREIGKGTARKERSARMRMRTREREREKRGRGGLSCQPIAREVPWETGRREERGEDPPAGIAVGGEGTALAAVVVGVARAVGGTAAAGLVAAGDIAGAAFERGAACLPARRT